MGDNARQNKDWHNVEVGQGYQARGVIRQRTAPSTDLKIVDMSKASVPALISNKNDEDVTKDDKKDKKKKDKKKTSHHKSSKDKKHKKEDKAKKTSFRFNPLLQLLASRLSDKTLSFT